MAAPTVSMQQLIEAGAHFGHQGLIEGISQ